MVQQLISFVKGDSQEVTPVTLRSPLGVQSKNNWIYQYSIGEALTLVAISNKEIKQNYSPHYELSRDFMFDKIILLALTYF